MHPHTVFYYFLAQVVVVVPEESQIVSIVFFHQETKEHLLDVCYNCNKIFPEPYQHTKQGVVEVRA